MLGGRPPATRRTTSSVWAGCCRSIIAVRHKISCFSSRRSLVDRLPAIFVDWALVCATALDAGELPLAEGGQALHDGDVTGQQPVLALISVYYDIFGAEQQKLEYVSGLCAAHGVEVWALTTRRE